MGLMSKLFGDKHSQDPDRLQIAENYIREHTALYRHYCIPEVRLHVKQWAGVEISDAEAVQVVQGIRNEYDMGSIRSWHMPGYVEETRADGKVYCPHPDCQGYYLPHSH